MKIKNNNPAIFSLLMILAMETRLMSTRFHNFSRASNLRKNIRTNLKSSINTHKNKQSKKDKKKKDNIKKIQSTRIIIIMNKKW